jgi:cytochrome c peroxidase
VALLQLRLHLRPWLSSPDPFRRQFILSERNRGITWALDDRLAFLGQRLFFDARLSGTATTACASCHDPSYGFAEPRRVSISDSGQHGRRNAPSLLDVGFLPTLMWDGRFRTLEQQALSPFQRGEMGIGVDQAVKGVSSDPQYVHLFRAALGRWPTADGVARALAAFQRTLVSPASRVDRFLVNNEPAILTPLAAALTARTRLSRVHPARLCPFPHGAEAFFSAGLNPSLAGWRLCGFGGEPNGATPDILDRHVAGIV